MVWPRYVLYFAGITLVCWIMTQAEISSPGSLRMQVLVHADDSLGTSEFSPVELVQPMILAVCALLMAWVARNCPSQRTLAMLFGGLAIVFLIRELDYFIDRYLADNLWQALIAVVFAPLVVYTYRQRRRLRVALSRVWPSPGLALLFAGAVIIFGYVQVVGHEPFWMALLGDDYRRVIKLAVEEFIELIGYFIWLIGIIEYTYQAQAIAHREPQPAETKLRQRRRQAGKRRF